MRDHAVAGGSARVTPRILADALLLAITLSFGLGGILGHSSPPFALATVAFAGSLLGAYCTGGRTYHLALLVALSAAAGVAMASHGT